MYLVDYRFEIVHFDTERNEFFARPITEIDQVRAVRIERPALVSLHESFILDTQEVVEHSAWLPKFGDVTLCFDPSRPCFAFRDAAGAYLTRDGAGYGFARSLYNMWEYFWLVDEQQLGRIAHLLANRWISKRTGVLYGPDEVRLRDEFRIEIGPYWFDLRLQVPGDFGTYAIDAITEGWKPERFLLYRPLVYITAYTATPILNQLSVCVRSLRDIGRFDGPIVVMTDQPSSRLKEICNEPEIDADPITPADFVGYVCTKYCVFDKPVYAGYQPLMYLDPDIVLDRDVTEMLVEATRTEQICMPLELFHRLQTNPPNGATLLQLDALDPGPYAAGANGGTLIIPNTQSKTYRRTFELVARTLTHIGLQFGRRWSPWADQEALNYVAYKMGGFNTAVLTPYARFVDLNHESRGHYAGFVHFWGHSSEQKVIKMRQYLHHLYERGGIERQLPAALD